MDLSGDWQMADAAGDYACTIRLPGDGITALHAAGLIPDPYFGRNEHVLRWVADRTWVVRRQFDLADVAADLVLEGLDTVCTVRVNGQVVAETRNAFREVRCDLSFVGRVGVNDLEITFHPAPAAAKALSDAQPFYVPYIHMNNPVPHGNMLRKPGCDWGWDWNIALVPFGVMGRLAVEPHGVRIDRLMVAQEHRAGAVTLRLTAHLDGAEGQVCRFSIAGQTVEATVAGGQAQASVTLASPALWWPAGQGAQTLHDLAVVCGAAAAHRRIGLRQVELVTEKDAAGLSFKFRVNGRDIFAKGANWIPADALAGRITPAATRDLLQSAVDAHMNMIRVWGGGRYEPDSFYDACDELGLLVWQDFMFSCNLYPSTPYFLAEVRAEVAENVARIHHHACIAVWCGDNELIGALGWFPESKADRDRYLVNYDRLNRTIEDTLKATVPDAVWWPSSPSPGPMNFGDAWHQDGSGDMHFWSVWHEGRDFDHYREVSPRFCSEFGFQSYPSMDVIERFTAPADRNIASPVLESHQKNAGGNARIAETMFRYFRWPQRFDDFVWLSQIQQGLAIKTAVTHWRSLKPHCMGTLIWQLNDTWPVCSWSSLDHGGGWKMLHYMAKRFYQPVLVTAVPGRDGITVRAVNDRPAAVNLAVTLRAVAMEGQTRALPGANLTVAPDAAVTVTVLPPGTLQPGEMLVMVWANAANGQPIGGDVWAPAPYKTYDLVDPRLSLTATRDGDAWQVKVSAQALSHFTTVQADQPGRFSNAAFTLFPGAPATVTFTPAAPGGPAPTFSARDLHSATCT
jgi:beta-mannosidase